MTTPSTMLTLERAVLVELLDHAASAAHLVGRRDDDAIAAGPLGNHVDAIVHGLTELLGDPHTLAAPEQSACSTVAPHELAPAPGSGLRIAEPAAGARPACE